MTITTRNTLKNRNAFVALAATLGLVASACGGDSVSEASPTTRSELVSLLSEEAGTTVEQSECVIDTALESYTLDELAVFADGDVSPEVKDEIAEVTTECVADSSSPSTNDVPNDAANEDEPFVEADVSTTDADVQDQPEPSEETPDDPDAIEEPEPTVPSPIDAPEPTVPAPPVAEPVTTDVPAPVTTDVPAPVTTEAPPLPDAPLPPRDEEPVATEVVHVEFCAASEHFYRVFVGADFVPDDDPVLVEAVFVAMGMALDDAIAAAPTPEFAVVPQRFSDALAAIVSGLKGFGYDLDAFAESHLAVGLEPQLNTLTEVGDNLVLFLETQCLSDLKAIEQEAEQWANQLIDTVGLPDTVEVRHADDRIRVNVPVGWSDVRSAVDVGVATLIASPDATRFLAGWDVDGVHIRAIPTDGGADGSIALARAAATRDCVLQQVDDYADEFYVGTIARFDNCGGTSTEAVLIGVNDLNESVEIVVAMQFANGIDERIVNEIAESFIGQ